MPVYSRHAPRAGADAASGTAARGGARGGTRGRGRGRGEEITPEVLRERANKDRHKAAVGNHNRKRGADKKLKMSMGYMPPSS